MNVLMKKKGFTLVELIVVIAIIGILAAVLIPNLTGYLDKSRKSAAEQDALSVYKEFIATVDAVDEQTLLEADYVVVSGDYYVVIVNGGLNSTFAVDETTELLNKLKEISGSDVAEYDADTEFSRDNLPQEAKFFKLGKENSGGDIVITSYYK